MNGRWLALCLAAGLFGISTAARADYDPGPDYLSTDEVAGSDVTLQVWLFTNGGDWDPQIGSDIWITRVRDGAWPARHAHHCCALAWPSSVPSPVRPTLVCSKA